MPTCFFIGHRDAPQSLQPRLAEAVRRHITEYGVAEFVVGHYGGFDRMAAGAVQEAKKQHPDVRLVLLLPYFPDPRADALAGEFDATYYPPGRRDCSRRNIF